MSRPVPDGPPTIGTTSRERSPARGSSSARDGPEQHVGRLERLDPAGEQQHDRRRRAARAAARAACVGTRPEDVEVDAGVDHLDPAGVGVVELDQLLGLEIGVGDQHVRGLDDLLLADHPGERFGSVAVGQGVVLDLGHRVHRVHQRDAPPVAGERADLTGEPVVASARRRSGRPAGTPRCAAPRGRRRTAGPGSSSLVSPSNGPAWMWRTVTPSQASTTWSSVELVARVKMSTSTPRSSQPLRDAR